MDTETFNAGPWGKNANVVSIYKPKKEGLEDSMIII